MDNYKELEEKVQHGDTRNPVAVYYTDCTTNGEKTQHWHHEMEISYVLEGSGVAVNNQERFKISKGDVVFVPKDVVHYLEKNEDDFLKIATVVFNLDAISNLSYDYCQGEFIYPLISKDVDIVPVLHPGDTAYNEVEACIKDLIQTETEKAFGYPLKTKSLFHMLFYYLYTAKHITYQTEKNVKRVQRQNAIKKVIRFINENYNAEFSTKDLAEIAQYSEFHFIRSFKEQTGKTCKDYINTVRLEKSVYLLESTKMPITEIASAVGYNDLSYFIKVFKKKFGISPNRYRKASK